MKSLRKALPRQELMKPNKALNKILKEGDSTGGSASRAEEAGGSEAKSHGAAGYPAAAA